MTMIELMLSTAIKEAGEFCDVRLSVEDAEAILKVVKEMEPVEPKVLIDTWVCGNCNTRLERQSLIGPNVLMDEQFNYCPSCGRKVKWK